MIVSRKTNVNKIIYYELIKCQIIGEKIRSCKVNVCEWHDLILINKIEKHSKRCLQWNYIVITREMSNYEGKRKIKYPYILKGNKGYKGIV